ncbi:DUF6275 family protein [Lactobacillus sp. ESL0681]|uniref:DUF6275 family protein n=1 Tax=Lactobacillus sp. ESL0681 TaxID=2983211 RepID=UPI0023F8AD9C|nr:DUF6275 family protein [Lactobacillus sp. ESL0681]WEV40338.1 DUF6275 family protein [Lactobacillus sp. ESL0681]
MDNKRFISICKQSVAEYAKADEDSIFVTWLVKAADNNKAMLGIEGESSDYYECTYKGSEHKLYMDVYTRAQHLGITDEALKSFEFKQNVMDELEA